MSTDIIATVTANPVTVLTNEKTYSEFYARMKAECDEFEPDLSTVTSRAKISAQAYKVTRTKTAIDAAGKKLNEDARAQINAVDASRRKIRDELDALAEEVRRPLTEWEEAEKARAAKVKEIRENVIGLGNSSPHETPQDIRDRLDQLAEIILSGDILGDEYADIVADRDASLAHLRAHLERAVKAEEDAAELARLRAEQEAREQAEREAKEKAEREESERIARERVEAEYKANVEREAEKARQAEILKAKAEQERIEREAAERVAKAEAEAKRVKEDAERAERERLAKIEQTQREERERQEDREHRGKIMREAKEAIMALGPDEEMARKIVLAMVAGEIPHCEWRF